MKNVYIIILFFLGCAFNALHAQDYKVSSYQDVYTEIEDYTSMVIEQGGDIYWAKRFELDFEFPFFDRRYNYLNFDEQSVGDFDDSEDYSIFLMSFGYMYDIAKDTIDIQSDVRYKLTSRDGIKALVIQYTKNRLFSDTTVAVFDSYINFQCWFFENGTIEIRFGDINLDHSAVYVEGEGFYLQTTQGPKRSGPFIGLVHPLDLSRSIGLFGPYDSLQLEKFPRLLTTMPPKGWVIKFENVLVNSEDIAGDPAISIFPNPVRDGLWMNGVESGSEFVIMNQLGRVMKRGFFHDNLKLFSLDSGMYYIRIMHGDQWVVRKFIKL